MRPLHQLRASAGQASQARQSGSPSLSCECSSGQVWLGLGSTSPAAELAISPVVAVLSSCSKTPVPNAAASILSAAAGPP